MSFRPFDYYVRQETVRENMTNAVWQKNRGFVAKEGHKIPRKYIKDFTPDELYKYNIDYETVDTVALDNSAAIVTAIEDNTMKENDVAGLQFLNLCRRIRAAVKANLVTVDETQHKTNGGRNLHLAKLVETCGMSFKEFVLTYLSNIQPCTLMPVQEGKKQGAKDLIVLYDTGYKIRLYIKLKDKGRILVSFHEDNILGVSHCDSIASNMIEKPYAFLLLDTNWGFRRGELVTQGVRMSRGLATLNFNIRGMMWAKDLMIVSTTDLNDYLCNIVTNYISQLCAQVGILTKANVEAIDCYRERIRTPDISVTSYGGYTISMLSLIIDLYPKASERQQKNLLAVMDIIVAEDLTSVDMIAVKEAITNRYLNYTNNALEHFNVLLED
jgi:hypothetical protein